MVKAHEYTSSLAPYIEELITQKRAQGYIYGFEADIFELFDRFCIENGFTGNVITRELIMAWSEQRPVESLGYRSQRISFVRQLCLYMSSLGIDSYIPKNFSSKERSVPHIMSKEELSAFFASVDQYSKNNEGGFFYRFALGYRVLFRLYYFCGMRLSEGVGLGLKQVDLKSGRIQVLQSKGRKDRVVYMSDDLKEYCSCYAEALRAHVADTAWLFPGKNPEIPMHKSIVCRKFRQFWEMTPYAATCDKPPTTHSLRHGFVVDKMNEWMAQGKDLGVLVPYLCKYLGHHSPKETFYYYHQVQQAFSIIREKDKMSPIVIPEVADYEE